MTPPFRSGSPPPPFARATAGGRPEPPPLGWVAALLVVAAAASAAGLGRLATLGLGLAAAVAVVGGYTWVLSNVVGRPR